MKSKINLRICCAFVAILELKKVYKRLANNLFIMSKKKEIIQFIKDKIKQSISKSQIKSASVN